MTPGPDGTVTLHTVHAVLDSSGPGQTLMIESRPYEPGSSRFGVFECVPVDEPDP